MFLLTNGTVITSVADGRVIKDGAVAFEGSTIVGIGRRCDLMTAFPKAELIDAGGGLIIPGLINMHLDTIAGVFPQTTAPESAELGLFYNSSKVEQQLSQKLTLKACYYLAAAAAAESIRNGVTSAVISHSSPNCISGSLSSVCSAFRESGMRACISYKTSALFGEVNLIRAMKEYDAFSDFSDQLRSPFVASAFGISKQSELSSVHLAGCANKAGNRTIVIDGSSIECEYYQTLVSEHVKPVDRLINAGLLKNNTLLTGYAYADKHDIDGIRKSGCGVVLTPLSNAFSGRPSVSVSLLSENGADAMIGTGTFGTDVLASARCLTAQTAIETGSLEKTVATAAKALFKTAADRASGLFFGAPRIGELNTGAAADIAVFDNRSILPITEKNAAKYILTGLAGNDCTCTISGGRIVMFNRKLTYTDENSLYKDIRTALSGLIS